MSRDVEEPKAGLVLCGVGGTARTKQTGLMEDTYVEK